ncbi:MAG: chromophore lyase CpcT/CpeT [Phycisphaerae bacterium]
MRNCATNSWIIALSAAVLLTVGCQTPGLRGKSRNPVEQAALESLADMLAGEFSSSAQAMLDPDYYEIRLCAVRIWRDRDDGPWLYIEQSAADRRDQPYRQRVYRLREAEKDVYLSEIYELPAPESRFVGACDDLTKLDTLTPAQLSLRAGCTVYLQRDPGGGFAGSTRGTGCESRLAEASYATSEVVITEDLLQSWDRGFDADHQQVWGATKGPYIFVRMRPQRDGQRDADSAAGPPPEANP